MFTLKEVLVSLDETHLGHPPLTSPANTPHRQAIVWALWLIACFATVARVALRRAVQGSFTFRAEDWLAFAAFAFLSGLAAVVTRESLVFMMTQTYLLDAAKDPETPLPLPAAEYIAQTEMALKLMFSQMILFWSTLWAGKFSLLVFFRQMVVGIPKYMYVWWGVFSLVLVTFVATLLSNFLTCVPLQKYWSATGCSDPKNLARSDASIKFATAADIAADILIMLLPLRLLATLRINAKQKLALAGMFSLGLIVIAFAFVRLVEVTKATAKSKTDPTTVAEGPILLSVWSVIEAAVAVVVANLPAFRSLLRTRGKTGASGSSQERYRGATGGSNAYSDHMTSSRGRPSRLGRNMEMESLHSSDDILAPGLSDMKSTTRVYASPYE